MNITGTAPNYLRGAIAWSTSDEFSGALGGKGGGEEKIEDQSDSNGRHVTLKFNAAKNWTGSTSGGTAHSHSFSSSATIGSGSYIRPSSTSTLILIRY